MKKQRSILRTEVDAEGLSTLSHTLLLSHFVTSIKITAAIRLLYNLILVDIMMVRCCVILQCLGLLFPDQVCHHAF